VQYACGDQGIKNHKKIMFLFLGFGLGLRKEHYQHVLKNWPQTDWFEAMTEDFLLPGSWHLPILEKVRERYPVALHGVSLSLGGTDPLSKEYLKSLKRLVRRIRPALISDHLSWSKINGHHLHELLPMPYTEQALKHVVRRIRHVQDALGEQILIENVCSYLKWKNYSMAEWEFLGQVAVEADCKILLDINNIYISSLNHSFDPKVYIQKIPSGRIAQFHLGGHLRQGAYMIDSHDHPVADAVWKLYSFAQMAHGGISTSIEWDDKLPSFERLQEEAETADRLYRRKIDGG